FSAHASSEGHGPKLRCHRRGGTALHQIYRRSGWLQLKRARTEADRLQTVRRSVLPRISLCEVRERLGLRKIREIHTLDGRPFLGVRIRVVAVWPHLGEGEEIDLFGTGKALQFRFLCSLVLGRHAEIELRLGIALLGRCAGLPKRNLPAV